MKRRDLLKLGSFYFFGIHTLDKLKPLLRKTSLELANWWDDFKPGELIGIAPKTHVHGTRLLLSFVHWLIKKNRSNEILYIGFQATDGRIYRSIAGIENELEYLKISKKQLKQFENVIIEKRIDELSKLNICLSEGALFWDPDLTLEERIQEFKSSNPNIKYIFIESRFDANDFGYEDNRSNLETQRLIVSNLKEVAKKFNVSIIYVVETYDLDKNKDFYPNFLEDAENLLGANVFDHIIALKRLRSEEDIANYEINPVELTFLKTTNKNPLIWSGIYKRLIRSFVFNQVNKNPHA